MNELTADHEQRVTLTEKGRRATDGLRIEPDSHWSFKKTPAETSLARILKEAEDEWLRAVAVEFCDMPMIALDSRKFPQFILPFSFQKIGLEDDWNVFGLPAGMDPAAELSKWLADYDVWAAKKHRTTVVGWR